MKSLKFSSIVICFILAFFLTSGAVNKIFAQESSGKMKMEKMNTYLIKLPHTAETCLQALDEMSKADTKILNKVEWGCMSGDHTGYLTVQSKDEKTALAMLPEAARKDAVIEKVDRFTKEQIRSFHEKKK